MKSDAGITYKLHVQIMLRGAEEYVVGSGGAKGRY